MSDEQPPGAARATKTASAADHAHYRRVLGHFATGVVAVVGRDTATGEPVGMVANSFVPASASPPLISLCIARTSSSWPRIRDGGRIGVVVLSETQRAVSAGLAGRSRDKFRDLEWTDSPGGLPVPVGGLAEMECEVAAELPAGDHEIVLCRVVRTELLPCDEGPLLSYRGGYGAFGAEQDAAAVDPAG
ncbi:flavin reductase family protein [Streptomyces tsukubensis]|uniref:flavin reductase family protein n=1 Tax=Streptomyces tsukubensis TaxID=83656 RepID=UPI0034506A05